MTQTAAPPSYADFVASCRAEARELVLVDHRGDHAVVTMHEPDRLNPLSGPLTVQLLDRLTELAGDPAVRAVVLTGSDPGFSAGGDLSVMESYAQPVVRSGDQGATSPWRWIRNQFGGIAKLLVRSDTTFVAAVNGPAAGVGLAFALACDVIVVSERAQVVPAFGKIGLVPEVGTSWLLTRRLGYQRAYGLFVQGRPLSGAEAMEAGLVNELVAHDDLLPAALKWCQRVTRLPDHVPAMTKTILRQAADLTWEQAIAMEEFAEPMCFTTEGHRAGVAALRGR
jgi:2-(1,2-epoxy-1,2-dihydrophenyl)acetyl-CoA isomerase